MSIKSVLYLIISFLFSTVSAPVLQTCSCQVPFEGYRNSACSCPQHNQQHQHQSAFTPTPTYPQSHYPLLPVHHIPTSGVSFSPIPVAGSLAISTMIPTLHGQPEMMPSRLEETFYQRPPVCNFQPLDNLLAFQVCWFKDISMIFKDKFIPVNCRIFVRILKIRFRN